MTIDTNVVNFAKGAAEKAYYNAIIDQVFPFDGFVRNLLMNIVWAADKKYTQEFWAAGDEHGYDYYVRVDGNTAHIREVKNSARYVNHVEIGCGSLETAVDAIRYLYVD